MGLKNGNPVDAIRAWRKHLVKHLRGLTDQLDCKPYAQGTSIRETVAHLIVADGAADYLAGVSSVCPTISRTNSEKVVTI